MNKMKLFFFILISQIIIWGVLHNLNLNLAVQLDQLEEQKNQLSDEIQRATIKSAQLTALNYLKQEADRFQLKQIDKITQTDYSPLAFSQDK